MSSYLKADDLENYQKALQILGVRVDTPLDFYNIILTTCIQQSLYFIKQWEDIFKYSHDSQDINYNNSILQLRNELSIQPFISVGVNFVGKLIGSDIKYGGSIFVDVLKYYEEDNIKIREEEKNDMIWLANMYKNEFINAKRDFYVEVEFFRDSNIFFKPKSEYEGYLIFRLFKATSYFIGRYLDVDVKKKSKDFKIGVGVISHKAEQGYMFFERNKIALLDSSKQVEISDNFIKYLSYFFYKNTSNNVRVKIIEQMNLIDNKSNDNDDSGATWEDVSDSWGGSGGYFDN
jgi:hypothetical protein